MLSTLRRLPGNGGVSGPGLRCGCGMGACVRVFGASWKPTQEHGESLGRWRSRSFSVQGSPSSVDWKGAPLPLGGGDPECGDPRGEEGFACACAVTSQHPPTYEIEHTNEWSFCVRVILSSFSRLPAHAVHSHGGATSNLGRRILSRESLNFFSFASTQSSRRKAQVLPTYVGGNIRGSAICGPHHSDE